MESWLLSVHNAVLQLCEASALVPVASGDGWTCVLDTANEGQPCNPTEVWLMSITPVRPRSQLVR
jgi:hypothetical protein